MLAPEVTPPHGLSEKFRAVKFLREAVKHLRAADIFLREAGKFSRAACTFLALGVKHWRKGLVQLQVRVLVRVLVRLPTAATI